MNAHNIYIEKKDQHGTYRWIVVSDSPVLNRLGHSNVDFSDVHLATMHAWMWEREAKNLGVNGVVVYLRTPLDQPRSTPSPEREYDDHLNREYDIAPWAFEGD